MSGYWTAFLAGLVVGVGVGSLLADRLPLRRRLRRPTEPTYGHPKPPVSTLRKMLPKPPSGHAWQTRVDTNERGHVILTTTLVSVLTGDVASYRRNLTVDTKYVYPDMQQPWAEQYRKYPTLKKNTFNEVLGPIVDWAATVVNTVEPASDYRMGA